MQRGLWPFARHVLVAATLIWVAAFSPLGAATLTLDQARQLAAVALDRGDYRTANTVAHGLAKADPDNLDALLLLAITEPPMGRAPAGRQAGQRAFRLAPTKELKHKAAYVTARAALAEKRYTSAQWWLRRAYHTAGSEENHAQVARAFQQVRAQSPLRARVDFSFAPTSNVNGGTEAEYLVINDQITGGTISEGSRALAGWRASGALDLRLILNRSAKHQTSLGFYRLQTWNALSDDDVDVDARAFDYGVAELELTHRLADAPAFLPDTYSIAIGQVWSGLEPYERVGRLSLSRGFELGARTRLRVTGEVERRLSDLGRQDRDGTELKVALSHDLSFGTARLTVGQTDVRSDNTNADYTQQSVSLSLFQKDPIAGVRLSGTIRWAEKIYSSHGSGYLMPNTERRDIRRSGSVSAHLERFDFMGFSPVVTYSAEQTDSNFNLYESRSYGWSLGLRSAF